METDTAPPSSNDALLLGGMRAARSTLKDQMATREGGVNRSQ
jgi:hypothetical protein